jgi:hypothetical protein
MAATAPHRPDRVDHGLRRQPIALGDLRLADAATTEQAARIEQLRARSAMDRPIHATAAEQRSIGGVDDGVHGEGGDIGLSGMDGHGRTWFHAKATPLLRDHRA